MNQILRTTIIVSFPGETDEDFQRTTKVARKIDFVEDQLKIRR